MNKLIGKIACAVMAVTLIAGVITGCKKNTAKPTVELPSFTSVKDASGNLPEKGTVGDMKYEIMKKEQFGCYNKPKGYYVDQLEQLDSPMYIIITTGTKTAKGADIQIVNFGMQGSKLVIVVEETKDSSIEYEGLKCPCTVLEVDHMPDDLLIVSTTGEEFEHIKPE